MEYHIEKLASPNAVVGEGAQPEAVLPLDTFIKLLKSEVADPLSRKLDEVGKKIDPLTSTMVEAFDVNTGGGYNKIGASTVAAIDRRT